MKVIRYGNGINGKSAGTAITTFADQQTHDDYIADLEAWDDAFVAQWDHLDDDALDANIILKTTQFALFFASTTKGL